MCGICGFWDSRGADENVLRRMADRISHRGPDDDGFYTSESIGLANRRLSIIDLQSGKQPISNEDGTLWIVFNGEIYNYEKLRDELLAKGHRFRTNTDTETIVHLYEEYGDDCVKHLGGMFAFAIWDTRKRRLFVARDPLGQKPLYYLQQNDHFVFGSEIKSILEFPGVEPKMDLLGMHECISLRCITGDRTLFEGIKKLPAGHSLSLQNGSVSIKKYWDLQYQPKHTGSPQQIVSDLTDLLQKTVASHMVGDVPVGGFLSGGIDSSLIVAMMAKAHSSPVSTFSIGVQEASFNELPYARLLAEHCGTNHYEDRVEPNVVGRLPEMVFFMEEPVDPFAFGVYCASRLAAQHVKVVLGGDGGDEMFAGYDRYLGNRLVDLYCTIPGPLRQRILEPIFDRLPDNFSYNNKVQKLRWLAAMSRSEGGQRYADSACFLRFTHSHKESLYSRDLWNQLGGDDASLRLVDFFERPNATKDIDRMLYTDVKTRLAEHLLMVGDRMTMAHSIEGRSPFVDRDVAEFVAAMPTNLKINGRRLKHALRESCRGLVPEALIKRKKQGFSFPLAYWFKNELHQVMIDLVANGRLVEAGYFNSHGITSLIDEHLSGKLDHNYRLWLLLNLELWYRVFIEGDQHLEVMQQLDKRLCPSSPSPIPA